MNQKPLSRISLWGRILLIAGILFLVLGAVLFLATGSSFAIWTILFSVVLNVIAITLLTSRKR